MYVLLNVSDKKVAKNPQHIQWDSKLLAPVVYFAVETSLWAVWAEQHAQYT